MNVWERLSRIGTTGLSAEDHRKVSLLNQCAVIAAATNFGFGAGYLLDPSRFSIGLILNGTAGVLQLGVLWLTARQRQLAAELCFLICCNLQLAGAALFLGPNVGYHYYFLAFVTVVALVVPWRHRALYAFSLASIAAFLYFEFRMRQESALVQLAPDVARLLKMVTVSTTSLTLLAVAALADADTRSAEASLRREHARSEELLLNILPRSISERLKAGEKGIADGFSEVSVLFGDIVGFTLLAARLPPGELVKILNTVFSRFDDIADRFGVEKIKTIGDAYMVAAGLPEPQPDHARVAVDVARAMLDALEKTNTEFGTALELRIGIHSGPVVAGVIGKRKFVYDLWGDTVNTASRMESHGQPGRVHVSERTAELLDGVVARGEVTLEPRGKITIKGKGEMSTFLLKVS